MAGTHTRIKKSTKRIISLCPDRLPEFGNQGSRDRDLFTTIISLNKQFTPGTKRATERVEEGLKRLGFVRTA